MRILSYLLLGISSCAADLSKPFVRGFEARGDRYVSNGPGYALEVTADGAELRAANSTVTLRLNGAGSTAVLEPLDRMPGRVNYFRRGEARSYPLYGRVRSRGVYPGIDVIFHGDQERVEYDFEIAGGIPAICRPLRCAKY